MKALLFVAVIALVGWYGYSQTKSDPDSEATLTETAPAREAKLNETFVATQYNMTPLSFECASFELTDKTSKDGCVLTATITNTSISDFKLNVDGNLAVTAGQTEHKSSQDISRQLIGPDVLGLDLERNQSQDYKIFFDVPLSAEIATVEIYESEIADPIVITL